MLTFAPNFDVSVSDRMIVLRDGDRLVRISSDGSKAFAKLKLLAEGVDRSELVTGLMPDMAEAFIETINTYVKSGYIVEYDTAQSMATTDTSIAILGKSSAAEELARNLNAAGYRVSSLKEIGRGNDDSYDAIVWLPCSLSTHAFTEQYRDLLTQEIPIITILSNDGKQIQVGPVVIGRDSSCVHCSATWRSSGLELPAEHLNIAYQRTATRFSAGTNLLISGVVISILEALRCRKWELMLQAITISTDTAVSLVSQHTVLKNPRCCVCGSYSVCDPWLLPVIPPSENVSNHE